MMNRYQIDYRDNILDVYGFPYELVDSNMFFIPSGETGIVVDPNENEELFSVFEKCGTKRVVIVLTHEHYDHTIGVEWLQERIESKLFCHKACADIISTEKGNDPKTLGIILTIRDSVDGGNRREVFMSKAKRYVLKADETFDEGCDLMVGDIMFRCIHTPGHSQGSAIYMLGDKYVFSGDSLIQNTPTILKLPGSDKVAYNEITKPLLKSLDKDVIVFPGHGEPFRLGDARFL